MRWHDQHFAPPSGIITLLTDFGNADGFVGAMKGVILGIYPTARIVDLTHEIAPRNIAAGAFLLQAHFKYFPRGTVHVAVVDPGVGTPRKALAGYWREHYYVAPDNGLLDFCAEDETCVAVKLTRLEFWRQEVSHTFHGRDIFAPVAAHLAAGVALLQLGEPISFNKHGHAKPCYVKGDALIGEIVYADRFGNLISNLAQIDFKNFVGNGSFVIQCEHVRINAITPAYGYARPGELIALINSFDCLELGVAQGNAQTSLAIPLGTPMIIKRGS